MIKVGITALKFIFQIRTKIGEPWESWTNMVLDNI